MKTVPIKKFGKDHWSLLAYVATRCFDHQGVLKYEHLRANPKTHPQYAHRGSYALGGDPCGFPYPTRLQGTKAVKGHDDWDCLDDLEKAGLIKIHGTGLNPVFALTVKGWGVVNLVFQHKANGGTFSTFTYGE